MSLSREAHAFDRWLTTDPGQEPYECPFGNEGCDDGDCTECENERALQDDYDSRED